MAVLPAWRGRGVGSALLAALAAEAQRRHMPRLGLQAPPAALDFYARHGFLPVGVSVAGAADEAQPMQRLLGAAAAPLLALAQRLPSVFRFRGVVDPVDQGYAAAYLVNDGGDDYFRAPGHRYDGETDLLGGGRARQLCNAFARVWERSRDCTELRALGW